jgi:hypothetical protein
MPYLALVHEIPVVLPDDYFHHLLPVIETALGLWYATRARGLQRHKEKEGGVPEMNFWYLNRESLDRVREHSKTKHV